MVKFSSASYNHFLFYCILFVHIFINYGNNCNSDDQQKLLKKNRVAKYSTATYNHFMFWFIHSIISIIRFFSSDEIQCDSMIVSLLTHNETYLKSQKCHHANVVGKYIYSVRVERTQEYIYNINQRKTNDKRKNIKLKTLNLLLRNVEMVSLMK